MTFFFKEEYVLWHPLLFVFMLCMFMWTRLTAFLPAYTIHVAPDSPISVCSQCESAPCLFCCLCMLCLYTWLYPICFIFCTIVNPIVPVAWLCFFFVLFFLVVQFALCMMKCACMCVCVCSHQVIFLHRGDLWYEPVRVLSCVPIYSVFPEHCDNSGETRTHWANERDKDLLSSLTFVFLFVSRSETEWGEKVKRNKSCCYFLDNIIMSNEFEFCNICTYVWKFCKFVIVRTFWHMSVCIFKIFKCSFLFLVSVLHVDCSFSFFRLKVLFSCLFLGPCTILYNVGRILDLMLHWYYIWI